MLKFSLNEFNFIDEIHCVYHAVLKIFCYYTVNFYVSSGTRDMFDGILPSFLSEVSQLKHGET